MIIDDGYIVKKRTFGQAKFDLTGLAARIKPLLYFTDLELMGLAPGTWFTYDVESYPNWFLISFREIGGLGRVVEFESTDDTRFDERKLLWMLGQFGIVGFNSKSFDQYLVIASLQNQEPSYLKSITDDIIVNELYGYNIEKKYRLNMPNLNHIDLIEVAPLSASLKTYGGRLHCEVMQDLPFDPNEPLTLDEMAIGRLYCGNDLTVTELMFVNLAEQLKLRADMSTQYGLDLRSKSDAQIAEAVICKELERLTGVYPKRQKLAPNYTFKYNVPDYVQFKTKLMQDFLQDVANAEFSLYENGAPACPQSLDRILCIGQSAYQFGVGGLHSTEANAGHVCEPGETLKDVDAESFYPRMICNQRLYPVHMGESFLIVYESIVDRRVEAKRSKNKVVADSLKITINGSFGKFGDKWSALYSPDFLVQVTISGQLSLLMLIETLELAGISVISANTDGIVLKYKTVRNPEVAAIIAEWETHCKFKTEETQYMGLFSRGVNSYIAVKRKQDKETKEWLYETDGCKLKGDYGNPWDDKDAQIFRFHKNPTATIVSIAVQEFITKGTPLAKTIVECKDVTKFVCVRNVKGGAVYCGTAHYLAQDGDYLGKVVRWYYAKGVTSSINYMGSGNQVATSANAVPLMDLSVGFPPDINYQHYINEARDALYDIGYIRKPTTAALIAA